ncbi:ABC transporter substrate-binding protein [uncultured Draconibacterium sp.]|uniref:ABC transporter substrate-binding protein n=1 Tax=uncultured Draconibacterium sp. TaxID=1573823 RepID=UPI003216A196
MCRRQIIVLIGVLGFLFLKSEYGCAQTTTGLADTIKVGLLISDSIYQEARQAAELAINEANSEWQSNKKFKLVNRSMEGPWGTGAKQTVDLVFNEQVYAIIGSHDGRNAHLAEQVIAKTQVVYVSAWAADPTLSQAYVPWFFSLVPNNIQQAKALCTHMYKTGNFSNVLVISNADYDAETGAKFFDAEVKEQGFHLPAKFVYSSDSNLDALKSRFREQQTEAIVLFGDAAWASKIIQLAKEEKIRIYGSWLITGESLTEEFKLQNLDDVIGIDAVYWTSEKGKLFSEKYKKKYGTLPGAAAAYAYDATHFVLAEINKSGFDRELFKSRLRSASYQGITGKVEFDNLGNLKKEVQLVEIKNGIPHAAGN